MSGPASGERRDRISPLVALNLIGTRAAKLESQVGLRDFPFKFKTPQPKR